MARCIALSAAFLIFLLLQLTPAQAANHLNPAIKTLNNANIYVSPALYPSASGRTQAVQQIRNAIRGPIAQGLPEKVALLPGSKPAAEAEALRNALGFSGVVIAAGKSGVGLATDRLSAAEARDIAAREGPICRTSVAGCASRTSAAALSTAITDENRLRHDEVIVSLIIFLVLASGIAGTIWWMSRKRQEFLARQAQYLHPADQMLSDERGGGE